MIRRLIVSSSLVLCTNLTAQHVFLPPQLILPEFTTEFSKQYTTWDWFGRVQKALHSGPNWSSYVSETIQSNLIESATLPSKWQDKHRFNGSFYRSADVYSLGLYTHSWLQVEKQGVSDNQFGNHIMGVFGRYQFRKYLSIEPYLGGQNAQNPSNSDWGWDAGVRGDVTNIKLGEYDSYLDFSSDYDLYEKRKNYENFIHLNIHTAFNEYTSDSLTLSYEETRKQHYSASGSDLLQANLYHRSVSNRLIYQFSPSRRLLLTTNLRSDDINYSTNRNVFRIENQLRYHAFSRHYSYGISFKTSDESQDVTDTRSDNQNMHTAFSLDGNYRWNRDNQIRFDLAFVKFQYDTPDDNNDDRDEQRIIAGLSYFHRFSSCLTMDWFFYTYLYHQIYLFNPQSQNNNWNRIYKLRPVVQYRTGGFSNKLSTGVEANYTVYDFEKQLSNKNSFIYRNYSFSDSMQIPIYKKIGMVFIGRIELEDMGSFFQDLFAQSITQSKRSHLYNIHLVNEQILNMRLSVGYTRFVRRQWYHIPVKYPARTITNSGPFINLIYLSTSRLVFSAYMAFSTLDDSKVSRSRISNGFLKLYYNF